jgi:hypothetical protein
MNTNSADSCQHILKTGKNKDKPCNKKIVCTTHKMCEKHNNMRIAQNYKLYGDYGNPDQTELWVKWLMSADIDKTSDAVCIGK